MALILLIVFAGFQFQKVLDLFCNRVKQTSFLRTVAHAKKEKSKQKKVSSSILQKNKRAYPQKMKTKKKISTKNFKEN